MKSLVDGRFVVAVLAVACLTIVLLAVAPIRRDTPAPGEYDPWLNWSACAWNRTYGGTGTDWAYAVVETTDGGYALAGLTNSFGAGDYDFWLVKTDVSGTIQWNQTYGGTDYDWASALVQTSDGGYTLAGSTSSSGAGDYDFWLVKTDVSGTIQWNQTYGGTDYDWPNALMQTTDGGYILAGITYSFGAGGCDFWLVKTDAAGTMQWNQTYGGTSSDLAYAVVQTGDGGYALAGYTASFGAGSSDSWLVKTDSTGHMQWNKTYGGTYSDEAYSLVQTGDGGYALAGSTSSSGAGYQDFWLVKTDSTGNMQWNQAYGGTEDDKVHALVQTADGGYALAGITWSFGAGSTDSWLVKTDAAGTMQWNQTYGGTDRDEAYAVVQTADGGYALAGFTHSSGAGYDDFWLVKTYVLGNVGAREQGEYEKNVILVQFKEATVPKGKVFRLSVAWKQVYHPLTSLTPNIVLIR